MGKLCVEKQEKKKSNLLGNINKKAKKYCM